MENGRRKSFCFFSAVAEVLLYTRGFVILIGDIAACCDDVLGLEFDDLELGAFVVFLIRQSPC